MYQMGPAGIDVVEAVSDPKEETTSEKPASQKTPPMISTIWKRFRIVMPLLPIRRPARRVRHSMRPFSPTVATPHSGIVSLNLNVLCEGESLKESRTKMAQNLSSSA